MVSDKKIMAQNHDEYDPQRIEGVRGCQNVKAVETDTTVAGMIWRKSELSL